MDLLSEIESLIFKFSVKAGASSTVHDDVSSGHGVVCSAATGERIRVDKMTLQPVTAGIALPTGQYSSIPMIVFRSNEPTGTLSVSYTDATTGTCVVKCRPLDWIAICNVDPSQSVTMTMSTPINPSGVTVTIVGCS